MIAPYCHTQQVSVDHAKLICTARKRPILPKSLIYGKNFHLELIRIPRTSIPIEECHCAICRCAKFNPIGFTGKKEIVLQPLINTGGDKMACEIQERVSRSRRRTKSICSGCLQITGPGLNHSCLRQVKRNASHNIDNISSREQTRRRKQNMSLLIGREADQEQEHIVGSVLSKLRTSKGNNCN